MSAIDGHAHISTKFGQLAPLLVGQASLFKPRGWNKTNVHVIDDSATYTPVGNNVAQFSGTARFVIPKRATLVGPLALEIDINAGTFAGGANDGAYVNCLGDQILNTVTVRYGAHILQSYPGEWQQVWRRITKHSNHEEGRNALVLGNLPPSVAVPGPEDDRRQAIINPQGTGVGTGILALVCPLDEIFFTFYMDQYWMPEAYAAELEIEIQLAALARIVYSDDGNNPFGGAVGAPTINALRLRPREVILPAPEKLARLQEYESERGHLLKFLDLEHQRRVAITGTGTGVAREFRVRLDNIRLDISELVFMVRLGTDGLVNTNPGVDKDWAGDPLESDTAISTVTGASVACITAINSFRLEANGKRLYDDMNDLINRAWVRPMYHPDAQIRDNIYVIPFAAIPEDRKNATGFTNASNLGNLELVLNITDWAAAAGDRLVDVFALSHNIIQSRRGDCVKSLK